jgi:hypothetical protein
MSASVRIVILGASAALAIPLASPIAQQAAQTPILAGPLAKLDIQNAQIEPGRGKPQGTLTIAIRRGKWHLLDCPQRLLPESRPRRLQGAPDRRRTVQARQPGDRHPDGLRGMGRRRTPAPKTIVVKGVRDAASRLAGLQTGELDLAYGISGKLLSRVMADENRAGTPTSRRPGG